MKLGNILAYNDFLVGKIRKILMLKHVDYVESASFGQLTFLINGKFLLAVKGDLLELRLEPEILNILESGEFNSVFSHTHINNGFITIDPNVLILENQLDSLVSTLIKRNRKKQLRQLQLEMA